MADRRDKNPVRPGWSLYLLRSDDGSLYTGISTDVTRRLEQHRSGRHPGARALRGKKSMELVFQVRVGNRSDASKLEHWVKQLPRSDKEGLVARQPTLQWLRRRQSGR